MIQHEPSKWDDFAVVFSQGEGEKNVRIITTIRKQRKTIRRRVLSVKNGVPKLEIHL